MGKNGGVSDLIDTTEMYLRTIYELVEEGIPPLRARIAERLHQSGPTVSQTVARMERDGLLTVEGDRHLQLTDSGMDAATRVMRKHRLAERLLVDVIGLSWEQVHEEACRWEHVISEAVELKLLEVLGHPTNSPYGNPIPGLDELGELPTTVKTSLTMSLSSVPSETTSVVVRRIGEPIQSDPQLLIQFWRAGIRPNTSVPIARVAGKMRIGRGDDAPELAEDIAAHVFVSP
jgi:DtxR family Mn-dependent transcriptional regulator